MPTITVIQGEPEIGKKLARSLGIWPILDYVDLIGFRRGRNRDMRAEGILQLMRNLVQVKGMDVAVLTPTFKDAQRIMPVSTTDMIFAMKDMTTQPSDGITLRLMKTRKSRNKECYYIKQSNGRFFPDPRKDPNISSPMIPRSIAK
jgi:hypothetical protein